MYFIILYFLFSGRNRLCEEKTQLTQSALICGLGEWITRPFLRRDPVFFPIVYEPDLFGFHLFLFLIFPLSSVVVAISDIVYSFSMETNLNHMQIHQSRFQRICSDPSTRPYGFDMFEAFLYYRPAATLFLPISFCRLQVVHSPEASRTFDIAIERASEINMENESVLFSSTIRQTG